MSPPYSPTSPSVTLRGQDLDLPARAKDRMSGRPQNYQDQALDLQKARASDNNRQFDMSPFLPSPPSLSISTTVRMPPNTRSMLRTPVTAGGASTSWSGHDDTILLNARSRSLGWREIQRENFPQKTPNACRKRYERLVAKRRGPDWDHEKFEKLCREYCQRREQTWKPLADAVGEPWEDIEKAVSLEPIQRILIVAMLIGDISSASKRASSPSSVPAAPPREVVLGEILLLTRPPIVAHPPLQVGRECL
jgi:hypothetical protein